MHRKESEVKARSLRSDPWLGLLDVMLLYADSSLALSMVIVRYRASSEPYDPDSPCQSRANTDPDPALLSTRADPNPLYAFTVPYRPRVKL